MSHARAELVRRLATKDHPHLVAGRGCGDRDHGPCARVERVRAEAPGPQVRSHLCFGVFCGPLEIVRSSPVSSAHRLVGRVAYSGIPADEEKPDEPADASASTSTTAQTTGAEQPVCALKNGTMLAPQPADGRAERPDKTPPDGRSAPARGQGFESACACMACETGSGPLDVARPQRKSSSRRVRHLFGPWRIRRRRSGCSSSGEGGSLGDAGR